MQIESAGFFGCVIAECVGNGCVGNFVQHDSDEKWQNFEKNNVNYGCHRFTYLQAAKLKNQCDIIW
jgi:hypothetical protein